MQDSLVETLRRIQKREAQRRLKADQARLRVLMGLIKWVGQALIAASLLKAWLDNTVFQQHMVLSALVGIAFLLAVVIFAPYAEPEGD